MGDAQLVGIDLEELEVTWTVALAGLKNCGALVVAADGTVGAVACTGYVDRTGAAPAVDDSGIVVLDLTSSPPSELRRFPAAELTGDPVQGELEFFAPRRVLAKTQTALGAASNNRLISLDLDAEDAASAAEVLLEARPSASGAGQGIVFGGMLCTPGCGDTCLVADADRAVLQRFAIDGEQLSPLGALGVKGTVGLPPRELGGL